MLGLRWRDVDLDARKIRVVLPFVRGEFGDPKSAGSGRSVPVAERVALALRELRERSLDRSTLVRRFKQALDCASVHRITFHELRHYVEGWVMWPAGVFPLLGLAPGRVPAT